MTKLVSCAFFLLLQCPAVINKMVKNHPVKMLCVWGTSCLALQSTFTCLYIVLLFLFACLVLYSAGSTQYPASLDQGDCKAGWLQHRKTCYTLSTANHTWGNANQECGSLVQDVTATLVEIYDQASLTILQKLADPLTRKSTNHQTNYSINSYTNYNTNYHTNYNINSHTNYNTNYNINSHTNYNTNYNINSHTNYNSN